MVRSFVKPAAAALLAAGMALGGVTSAPAEMHHGGGGHGGGVHHGGYAHHWRGGHYYGGHYYGGGYYGGPYYGGPYYGSPCIPVLGVLSGNYCGY